MRKARRKWVKPLFFEDNFSFNTAKERDKYAYGIERKASEDRKLKRVVKSKPLPKMNTDILSERVKYLILTGEVKVWKSLTEFKKRKCKPIT